MGILKRMFRISKASVNSVLYKLEDSIALTEQGINDLKGDLNELLKAHSEVKAISLRNKRDIASNQESSDSYSEKAETVIKHRKDNKLSEEETDELASAAINKSDDKLRAVKSLKSQQGGIDTQLKTLENNVDKLKSNINKWEDKLIGLRAKYKTAKVTLRVNKNLSGIGSDSTIDLLERMEEKVDKLDFLSKSYAETAKLNTSLDDKLDDAVKSSNHSKLDELKEKYS